MTTVSLLLIILAVYVLLSLIFDYIIYHIVKEKNKMHLVSDAFVSMCLIMTFVFNILGFAISLFLIKQHHISLFGKH